MGIQEAYKNYKMPAQQGRRAFFSDKSAEDWSFMEYFACTHNEQKKLKKYSAIKKDFLDDLHWIERSGAPQEVLHYVSELKQSIPGKATVKAARAKARPNSQINYQSICINGNNNVVKDIVFAAKKDDEAKSSSKGKEKEDEPSSSKRKVEEDQESVENKRGKTERQETSSIWKDWVVFLHNNENKFHPYSNEFHDVIRAGFNVSWKPNLDKALFERHLAQKEDKKYPLPETTAEYINLVVDSTELKEFKKNMQSAQDEEDQVSFDFLEELFRAYYYIYNSKQDIEASEAVFNNMLIFPFLKAVAIAVAEETSSSAEFVVGETPLVSMKRQLKEDESAKLYLADGLIRLYGMKNLELLLLETSSCFSCKDRAKGSFDHHKGVFGALSMMKAAADEFYLAKVNTFGKLKILFLHAFGNTLYLWSLRYVEEGPLYELWLEGSLELCTRFEDAIEHLPKAIAFFWKMKCLVEEGVKVLLALQDEHKAKLKQCRFNSGPVASLTHAINPTIMKLNEAEDKAGMADLGPFFF